jgi:hypothetical protein
MLAVQPALTLPKLLAHTSQPLVEHDAAEGRRSVVDQSCIRDTLEGPQQLVFGSKLQGEFSTASGRC